MKTAEKSHTHCVLEYFGYIELEEKKYFVTKPTLWNMTLEDSIFLSDVFESIEDKKNNIDCKKYLAFVLNDNLLSISRSYVDYSTEIPNEVILFVEDQIKKYLLCQIFLVAMFWMLDNY